MDFKIKNITLMEEVETEEARELLSKARWRYCALWLVPLILIIINFFGLVISLSKTTVVNSHSKTAIMSTTNSSGGVVGVEPNLPFTIFFAVFTIISIIAFVVCLCIYINKIAIFKKLLKIAKINDRIRHEERIREKERQRIRAGLHMQKINTEDIQKTINLHPMYESLKEQPTKVPTVNIKNESPVPPDTKN